MLAAISRSTLSSSSRLTATRCISSTHANYAKRNKPQNNGNAAKREDKITELPPILPTPAPTPSTSNLPSLDFSPSEEQSTRRPTGAKNRDTMTSAEKKRKDARRNLYIFLGVGMLANLAYMGREWDDEELSKKKWTKETAPDGRWARTRARYRGIFEFFADPISVELLPPPFPPPDNRPFTLVLSLDDLLVASTWDRQHGWRTAKRPGVDYFLAYLSQFYEIVVFTDQMPYTAEPILEQLDKYGLFITHRLFRESTRAINGEVAKDLSYLNRDLSKVVVVDTNPNLVRTHPDNAVIVPPWKGENGNAKGLVELIPFLESIAFFNYSDVRPVLKAFEGKNVSVEYAKFEADFKQKHLEKMKQSTQASGTFSLSSLFSSQRHPMLSTSSGPVDPKTLTIIDLKRMQAQQRYLEEKRHLERNKELFDRMLKEQQDQMKAAIPGSLWGVMQSFGKTPEQLQAEAQMAAKAGTKVPVVEETGKR